MSIILASRRAIKPAVVALAIASSAAAAQRIPERLSDQEFWKLVNDVSEPGGYFRSDNFLSNERQFQFVIPTLQRTTRPGGVYLGVGPEQNFTYIVGLQPRLAIIFDIRRQNLIEHLMYKALFELSVDRAEFLSRLFCRPRAGGLDSSTAVDKLFDGYRGLPSDSGISRRTRSAVKATLARHGFALTADDLRSLDYVYDTFCAAGPELDYAFPNSRGGFGGRGMPSYADLMTASDAVDPTARQRSYLATEANYRYLRSLQGRNLIVPVVGDFAGPKAIRTVGQYIRERGAIVTAFYASNVEQYLFQDPENWRKYYQNVATLPLDSSSTFIRSIGGGGRFGGFGGGGGFGPGRLGSVLCSMQELLKAFNEGRITTYADVIQMSR